YSSHNQPPHKQHLPQPLLIYFNHTSPNRTYTLSLHDALPILQLVSDEIYHGLSYTGQLHTAWEFSREAIVVNSFSKYWCMTGWRDRKSTRLNSSHVKISYAVFCLKKKKNIIIESEHKKKKRI